MHASILLVIACGFLFAAGHLIRDGFPALGHTHLARAGGALPCALGALVVTGAAVDAALVFVAVLAGYYTDMRHGEGQNAARPTDALWLILSGVTSLAPLAVALAILLDPWLVLIVLAGVLKPPIWFGCWRIFAADTVSFEQPTRVAAPAFGFCVGISYAAALAVRGAT